MLFLGRNWETSIDGPNGNLLKQFIHSKEVGRVLSAPFIHYGYRARPNIMMIILLFYLWHYYKTGEGAVPMTTPSISSRFGLISVNSVMKWFKIPEDGTGEMGISRDVARRVLAEFDERGDGYLSLPRLEAWLEGEPTRNSLAEAELKQAFL